VTALDAGGARPRTYRFAPLDRGGWVLGLGGAQCLALAAGVVIAGALLRSGQPAPAVLAPLALAALFAFGSWAGRPLHRWAPVGIRHAGMTAARQRRWLAPVRLGPIGPPARPAPPPLPPFLVGLEVLDEGELGVVRDRRERTASASVAVRGRRFSLIERGEQERVVERWGDALAAFCTEGGAVARVRVTERCLPAGVEDHRRFVQARAQADAASAARVAYDELLDDAGTVAVRHEALVTVTVDERARRSRSGGGPAAVLAEELRLLTGRLESAGLEVDAPLSAAATTEALRARLDPAAAAAGAARARSLAALAGTAAPCRFAPLATSSEWGHLRVDGTCHRTYWVAEWPRLEVGPDWLEPVLLAAGGVRTFSLHFEPVAPSRSRRRVDRDATRLAADEQQRARAGFRIGARHRRVAAAVHEREAELVAGYAELDYAGFLTVSAADAAQLARSCGEHEQVAAQAGLELLALDGRHDLGVVCALPLGRGLARRRLG